MPIYVYRCDSCRNSMEVLQKPSDAAPEQCPHCGAQGVMTKVIAPVGIIFKGTGFHKNDYTASKASSAPRSSSESGATTTESKPAEAAPAPAAETKSGASDSSAGGGSGA